MKSYINSYELWCNAGDTKSLMDAIYSKKSALVEDKTYLKEGTAGLGIMEYEDIYSLMREVVAKVLKESNLKEDSDSYKDYLLSH